MSKRKTARPGRTGGGAVWWALLRADGKTTERQKYLVPWWLDRVLSRIFI